MSDIKILHLDFQDIFDSLHLAVQEIGEQDDILVKGFNYL